MHEEEIETEEGISQKENEESAALLIGIYSGGAQKVFCEEYLEELSQLAETFGVAVAGKMACPLRQIDAATFLHKGKLEEVAAEIQNKRINLLIFDEEISPAQQRNLEKYLQIAVMDRTELILEIFAQRAQTKEAKLQIELARTKYEYPRLKRLWSHFSRQRARGGYLKGEGEKQIEIDRRLLKVKLERLMQQLQEVKQYRQMQRSARRRSGIPTFAIIGYTNAGKSTLLNALTEAAVLVEDKLFATLDPTTRHFTLPNNQEVLLTDTVGFIRKLPHTLVAAFRSTLEAALQDDILLHLVDISHPLAEEHAQTTHALLEELRVSERSMITVLNKIDRCEDLKRIERLRILYPKTVCISALKKTGFQELGEMMMQELSQLRKEMRLRIPQKEYNLVAAVRREGHILYEDYIENDVILRAEVPLSLAPQLEAYQDDTTR